MGPALGPPQWSRLLRRPRPPAQRAHQPQLQRRQCPDPVGSSDRERLSVAIVADLPPSLGGGRQCQERRARDKGCLCRPLHPRSREGTRAPDRRRSPRGAVPQTLHRVQRRTVRRLAPRPCHRPRTASRTPSRADRRSGHCGIGRRFPHRWGQGLLCPERRLCAGAPATGLPRTDQFLPDGAARTLSCQRPPVAPQSQSAQCVRQQGLCARRIDRRDGIGLPLRRARHRADRSSRRLSGIMARRAARGQSRDLSRGQSGEQGRRLAACPLRRDAGGREAA